MTARILVVDDVEANVRLLEAKLTLEYYDVLTCQDGATALKMAAAEQPDIILLDVMMPGKSGFEVCQAVRADEALAAVKILMLSAKGRDTDLAKGSALGADAYMTKPFSTRELAEKVRDLLGPA